MPSRPPAGWACSRGCAETLQAHLQGLEGLHELLQLIRRQEVPNEVLAPAHLCQLLGPLCPESRKGEDRKEEGGERAGRPHSTGRSLVGSLGPWGSKAAG